MDKTFEGALRAAWAAGVSGQTFEDFKMELSGLEPPQDDAVLIMVGDPKLADELAAAMARHPAGSQLP